MFLKFGRTENEKENSLPNSSAFLGRRRAINVNWVVISLLIMDTMRLQQDDA